MCYLSESLVMPRHIKPMETSRNVIFLTSCKSGNLLRGGNEHNKTKRRQLAYSSFSFFVFSSHIAFLFLWKTCNIALTFKVLRIRPFFMIWLSHDCFYFSLTFLLIHYIFQGIDEILLLSSPGVNNSWFKSGHWLYARDRVSAVPKVTNNGIISCRICCEMTSPSMQLCQARLDK